MAADLLGGPGTVRTQGKKQIVPELGVGLLGYAFMGKAHSNGFKKMPYIFWPPPAIPQLQSICGRDRDAVAEAALRYGFKRYTTSWKEMVDDPSVQVLDNCAPNDAHSAPCIEAARKGKHLICEKPLARNAAEAKAMWVAAVEAGIKHMCNFNYRLVPALCLARRLITEGRLGRIFHFRAQYLQEWLIHTPGIRGCPGCGGRIKRFPEQAHWATSATSWI